MTFQSFEILGFSLLYVTVEHRIADTTHTQGVQNLSCNAWSHADCFFGCTDL